MDVAPTWIDAGMASDWGRGERNRYNQTRRWFVCLDESCTDFMVLSGNDSRSSFGGDDTSYPANEVAAAIERWAEPDKGLVATPEFIEALENHLRAAETNGTRYDIVRARYLLDAMLTRIAVAKIKDALPFAEYGRCRPDDDGKDVTRIIDHGWGDGR